MFVELVVVVLVVLVVGPFLIVAAIWGLNEFANRARIGTSSPLREDDEDEIDHRFY